MKKNLVINTLLLITINSSLNGGFIDWAKCPWTWAGLTLSAATVKLGYWAYLSKKEETTAAQIDRARDELRKYPEADILQLVEVRNKVKEKKFVNEKTEREVTATLRKIGYPHLAKFTNSLGVFNVNPEYSPNAAKKVDKHLQHVLGDSAKHKSGMAPHVPKPNKRHKQQIKTLAWGTATVTCAIAAGECFTQSCQ